MNITKKNRFIAMTVAAATLATTASLVAAPAFAATSAGSVYIVSTDDGSALTNPINWKTGSVGLAATPTATDFKHHFAVPAGSVSAVDFLSTVGTEDAPAGWLATTAGDLSYVSFTAPDTLNDNPNVSGDYHTLLAAGGSWSLGLAFLGSDGSVKGEYFTTITIAAGSSTMTYNPPAAAVAPAITTQPTSTTVAQGASATFTAAASGSPAPTVQWQSAPSGTSTWSNVSGATSTTLTVSNVQSANAGTQYRAVFTNSAGSATTNAAVLTVTFAAPTQPTGSVAGGDQGPVNVPSGNTTFTKTFTGVPAGTYAVYAWSTPTQLPNATVDGSGNVTINIAGLPAGTHTIALVSLTTGNVVGWLTITIAQPANTSAVNLSVDVTTTNKFALEGVASAVNLGSAARGGTTSADLPAFLVTDDRDSLPGWNLTSGVADFFNDGVAVPANAGDVIPKSALTIEARKVGAAVTGIGAAGSFTAGSSNLFAQGLPNSSTPATGTQFDAKLTFAAPAAAKKGTYTSVLTLTLTSK